MTKGICRVCGKRRKLKVIYGDRLCKKCCRNWIKDLNKPPTISWIKVKHLEDTEE